MPVIAIVNRKGGSGKSTLAAHLAAWCAHQGNAVMLGDVDRQQSSRSWLRKRSQALPVIAPWTVNQNVLRVPTGITHVVLDTPGGLHGFDLARTVMFADFILMPVCGSAFDRESAADCHAELMALPRIAGGRCKVACIGMRIDTRTRAPHVLKEWAAGLGMPFLGVLRESHAYVQCLERGMTLFDLPAERVVTDLRQWQPILNWLAPQLTLEPQSPAAAATQPGPGLPNRLLATGSSVGVAAAARAAAASSASASAPLNAARTASGSLIPRPVPAVTRVAAPRVLDRVASNGPMRNAPADGASPAALEAAAAQTPPIPAFLKLVKC